MTGFQWQPGLPLRIICLYKALCSLNLRASQLDSRCQEFFRIRHWRLQRCLVEESPGSAEQNAR